MDKNEKLCEPGEADSSHAERRHKVEKRIARYLESAMGNSCAAPDFESPLKTFFNYCALLVSACNHPLEAKEARCFLDLILTYPGGRLLPLTLTTLPDCDLGYFDLSNVPKLSKRTGNPEELAVNGYQELTTTTFSNNVHVSVRIGSTGTNEIFQSATNALENAWSKFFRLYAKQIETGQSLWAVPTDDQWPDSIDNVSRFTEEGRVVLERLREILDQVALDLASATFSDDRPKVFFLRKTRYYSPPLNSPHRSLVSRFIYKHEQIPFLLGYFLSGNQVGQLFKRYSTDAEALIIQLKLTRKELQKRIKKASNDKWAKHHLNSINSLLNEVAPEGACDPEAGVAVLRGLETPIGDVPELLRLEVIRSVADTVFETGAPEIVWNTWDDPRYLEEFTEKADAGIVNCERWLWSSAEPNESNKNMSLIFVPYSVRRDPVFCAYRQICTDSPLGSEEALDAFVELSNRVIQSNRTAIHMCLMAYPALVLNAFSDHLLTHFGRRYREEEQLQDRNLALMEMLKQLNESCRVIALILDFPEVKFRVSEPEQSVWQCYLETRKLADRQGAAMNNWKAEFWENHPDGQWELEHIGYDKIGGDENVVVCYVSALFRRLMGVLIQDELPLQINALAEAQRGGEEIFGHGLRHEIKNLVRILMEESDTESKTYNAARLIRDLTNVIPDTEDGELGSRVRGNCLIKVSMELFEQLQPIPGQINGYQMQYRRLALPDEEGDWDVAIAPVGFYAAYNNLTTNAWEALRAVTADSVPEAQEEPRKLLKIQKIIEGYGRCAERFQSSPMPIPTILVCVRHFGDCVALEVLDNALAFGVPVDYINTDTEEGQGLRFLVQLERVLQDEGAVFERPRALDEDEVAEYEESGNLPEISTQTASQWTVARFLIGIKR